MNFGQLKKKQKKKQLEAAAALVQRKMAAVKEPAGQTAVVHEAGDAPPPKQEVKLDIFFKILVHSIIMIISIYSWYTSSSIHH